MKLTISMARVLRIVTEKKVFALMSLLCNRLSKYESRFFSKTISNNRILWDVWYQLQRSILLQQSFLLLSLCLLRQITLAWKNEWKTRKDVPIRCWKRWTVNSRTPWNPRNAPLIQNYKSKYRIITTHALQIYVLNFMFYTTHHLSAWYVCFFICI